MEHVGLRGYANTHGDNEAVQRGKEKRVAHREELVIVSSHGQFHGGGCDLCKPFDGNVLSLTGATEGYTTPDEAEAEGLFHPNCRHTYDLYIDENNPELGIIEDEK